MQTSKFDSLTHYIRPLTTGSAHKKKWNKMKKKVYTLHSRCIGLISNCISNGWYNVTCFRCFACIFVNVVVVVVVAFYFFFRFWLLLAIYSFMKYDSTRKYNTIHSAYYLAWQIPHMENVLCALLIRSSSFSF